MIRPGSAIQSGDFHLPVAKGIRLGAAFQPPAAVFARGIHIDDTVGFRRAFERGGEVIGQRAVFQFALCRAKIIKCILNLHRRGGHHRIGKRLARMAQLTTVILRASGNGVFTVAQQINVALPAPLPVNHRCHADAYPVDVDDDVFCIQRRVAAQARAAIVACAAGFDHTGIHPFIIKYFQQLRLIDARRIDEQRIDRGIDTHLTKFVGGGDGQALFTVAQCRRNGPLTIFRCLHAASQHAVAVQADNAVRLGITGNSWRFIIGKAFVANRALHRSKIIQYAHNRRHIGRAEIDFQPRLERNPGVAGPVEKADGEIVAPLFQPQRQLILPAAVRVYLRSKQLAVNGKFDIADALILNHPFPVLIR